MQSMSVIKDGLLIEEDEFELQQTGLLSTLWICSNSREESLLNWLYGNNVDSYHGELCHHLWKFTINTNPQTQSDNEKVMFQHQGSTSCRYCRMTPIHIATITNNMSALELLVFWQHDVNVTNERGETALHLACTNQKIEFVEYLLCQGADPNIRDVDGNVALHLSVAQRNFDIAEILLRHGAEVDVIMFTSKIWTPLHYVVSKEYDDMMDLLLKYDASAEELDINDESPISLAIEHGNEKLLKRLIVAVNSRCRVDKQVNILRTLCHYKKNKASVLHLACKTGRYNIAQLLLDEGATVNQEDAWRRTALHETAGTRYVCLVELLLKYGADIDAKDKDNKTPLRLAVEKRQPDMVAYLIRYGANLDGIGACLIEAIQSKHHEMTKTLLSFDQVNIDSRNLIGKTALIKAVEVCDEEMVDYLLARGANPNLTVKPKSYKRPIITEAIIQGNVRIVEALIHAGADLCRLDNAKNTPLAHAISLQQIQIVGLLMDTRLTPILLEARDFFVGKPKLAEKWLGLIIRGTRITRKIYAG